LINNCNRFEGKSKATKELIEVDIVRQRESFCYENKTSDDGKVAWSLSRKPL
jgi:hypothetical protein